MSLRDRYDFETLVNEAENLVLQELETQLTARGALTASAAGSPPKGAAICTCHDCILDMAALALNLVPPSYRVSLLGSIFARQGDRAYYMESVSRAVSEAIAKVQTNRSHD